jgi:hypothetical protein
MYVEIVNSDIQTGKFASPPMTLDTPTVGLHRMMKLPMECEVILVPKQSGRAMKE